ncbi:deoxyribonuclease IV [Desulfonema ishimotonii]|uniref:Probable endonuclease 4 n=1 Tax=Desulfonema ishimotonii TaxID=45657 RepID=A0A401G2H5_9BACT|nr:deoxyribonuclease IV [Desulfonema ishimotonii]GBC63439.1 deoxyribonuclease IV [Desulfonema ishimotonii]
MPENKLLIGAHFSISGGLHNALYTARDYGCTALQIFTKNARTWKENTLSAGAIARFEAARRETGITAIASHASYLINLATPEPEKREMACHALTQELIRSSALAIPWVILHPGAHMGKGEDAGMARIADAVRAIFDAVPGVSPRLLLETTAGQGSGIGHTFDQLAALLEKIDAPDRTGICLDTCHIFAAGYDIRTAAVYGETMSRFDAVIGLEHLRVIHLNDSKKPLGAKVDRHAHIGDGEIGLTGFACLMNDPRLAHALKIIETPKEKGADWDAVNLARLRDLVR